MSRTIKDYYQILGLSQEASPEDIRKAYLLYASKFHPDKHNGDVFFEDRFKEVKEAYEVLNDSDKRWRYDVKKFQKSKVKRQTSVDFEAVREVPPTVNSRFKLDIPYLDIYVAVFYFINLTAWVLLRRVDESAGTTSIIRSLFLVVASAFLVWLFANAVVETVKSKSISRIAYLGAYAVLAIASGWMALEDWMS